MGLGEIKKTYSQLSFQPVPYSFCVWELSLKVTPCTTVLAKPGPSPEHEAILNGSDSHERIGLQSLPETVRNFAERSDQVQNAKGNQQAMEIMLTPY